MTSKRTPVEDQIRQLNGRLDELMDWVGGMYRWALKVNEEVDHLPEVPRPPGWTGGERPGRPAGVRP